MFRYIFGLALLSVAQNVCLSQEEQIDTEDNLGLDTGDNNEDLLPDRENRVEDIYLRVYGSTLEDYVEIPIGEATRILEIGAFDKDNQTVFYAHGYQESANKESVHVVVSAYLEAKPDTNVILIDWSNMANGSYVLNAMGNTKKVGEAASEVLHKLIEGGVPLEKVHLIGHSLGGQVIGYMARDFKNKYNATVKRLTALDPALPGFYPDKLIMEHIKATDAEFVDIIHTDAGGYGAPVKTGTADFWPNEGKSVQPGCPQFSLILSDDSYCSHWRSWRFYAESVRNPKAFQASPAESFSEFKENKTPEVNMVYMGIDCDTSAQGSYYLTTNAQEPFGRGMDGITNPENTKK